MAAQAQVNRWLLLQQPYGAFLTEGYSAREPSVTITVRHGAGG